MQFDVEDDFLKIKQSDLEHDQELLQIQRRKSTPKVVIEEFVAVDDDEEDNVMNNSDEATPEKKEENKESEKAGKDGNRPHKVMTHIEIDDVSKNPLQNSFLFLRH